GPGFLLISATGGRLFVFDLERNELEPSTIPIVGPASGETFDIQYRSHFELVVANNDGHLDEFNLLTRQLTTAVSGLGSRGAIGVAVSPRGFYYVSSIS